MSVRPAIAVLVLFGAVGVACSAPVDDGADADESALSSSERVELFAKDDPTRVACRAATNRFYCNTDDALDEAGACAGKTTASHVKTESTRAPCAKSGEIYPTVSSCQTLAFRHCGFYSACLERALPCGEDGYALGFGERYCTAFRNTTMSEKGTAWATGVMSCLQRSLVARVTTAGAFAAAPEGRAVCSALVEEGFAAHPGCYTAREHSICFLPPSDLAAVLKTIGLQEIFTKRTSKQILETAAICTGQVVKEIGHRLSGSHDAEPSASSLDLPALRERQALFEKLERDLAAP